MKVGAVEDLSVATNIVFILCSFSYDYVHVDCNYDYKKIESYWEINENVYNEI